jgi:2-hydroxy-3-keto-5-methylthiopentenyl-1-phosphate phosphatase
MDTRSKSANNCYKRVSIPFVAAPPAYQNYLSDIKLDSGFKEFFQYCKSRDIPVIIVSRYGKGDLSCHILEALIL